MTVSDFVVEFKSKSKLYDLLTIEGSLYLSPKQYSTQKFLREIMLTNKLYVKWSKVKVIKFPQYKGKLFKIYWYLMNQKLISEGTCQISSTTKSLAWNGYAT